MRSLRDTSPLHMVIVGHVDHGKSTLIGRLLHDSGSLADGKKEEIEKICHARGVPFEWSYLLDAFQAERNQAVTIDATHLHFHSAKRRYVIIDAPGHREFLKNMMSGAGHADMALLVIDGAEGLQEQTRRHMVMLSFLGIKNVMVIINKMDRIDYSPAIFHDLSKQVNDMIVTRGLVPLGVIPAVAHAGDMLVHRGNNMDWYMGQTLIEALDQVPVQKSNDKHPARFVVQDIYRMGGVRYLAGRAEGQPIKIGDQLIFQPGGETSCVQEIKVWPDQNILTSAQNGQSVTIALEDRIFVERGYVGAPVQDAPPLRDHVRLSLLWLSDKPLRVGQTYLFRTGLSETPATVQAIERVIDTQTGQDQLDQVELVKNTAGQVVFTLRDPLPLDPFTGHVRLGRAVIEDNGDVVAAGLINLDGLLPVSQGTKNTSPHIYRVSHPVTHDMRFKKSGYRGSVFWLTGLSGAGKSTLAMAVERILFEKNYPVYVLDGDNVRHGLNADLGFSAVDRTENIRRVGEVAGLMADAGLIVVSAFISPFQADRDRARTAAQGRFHEIYIKADIGTCESRDPKGLYKKARAGNIADFTGIDSPYDIPLYPELTIDTQTQDIDTCVRQIFTYIEQHASAFPAPGYEKDL
ncbi:MAG: adenylyl-sulfate kinase [Alphaproteobacteria bacterium]|nr:adenylyl-sulfate kinase [Alphaproteobacteria bacterium]